MYLVGGRKLWPSKTISFTIVYSPPQYGDILVPTLLCNVYYNIKQQERRRKSTKTKNS